MKDENKILQHKWQSQLNTSATCKWKHKEENICLWKKG